MFALVLQQSPQPLAEVGGTIIPLILMMGLAWVLLIRPAQRQRKEQEQMRSALKSGDEVLTIGGIFGTVTKLRDDRVHVRIAEGVQIELARSAVSSVVAPRERE
jgi:preprotein translocase subunit YajC